MLSSSGHGRESEHESNRGSNASGRVGRTLRSCRASGLCARGAAPPPQAARRKILRCAAWHGSLDMTTLPFVATATYRDMWRGDIVARLVPQRTRRGGVAMTVYRWESAGSTCDGLSHGHAAPRMVQCATRNPFFTNVAVLIAARRLFAGL